MPTTYAHYRFGTRCVETLPDETVSLINHHLNLYNFGVHGPDIFFYYNPFQKNEVNSYGSDLHKIPFKKFLTNAREVYRNYSDKEALLSYLLGFLSHFSFDSVAHGYIEVKGERADISHNKVEALYDAHLMKKDGYRPTKVDRSASLIPSHKTAEVIASVFPFDKNTLYKALRGHKLVISILTCHTNFQRRQFRNIIRIFRINKSFSDLFIEDEEMEVFKDGCLRLDKLQDKALELYPKLVKNFLAYLEGKEELDDYFEHDFAYPKNYKEIPVLPYEEELNYKV